jgi:hypothetical protein
MVTNRPIDRFEEKVDLNDKALAVGRLGASSLMLVASPSFADEHLISADPADITDVPFLSVEEETVRPSCTLTGPGGMVNLLGSPRPYGQVMLVSCCKQLVRGEVLLA